MGVIDLITELLINNSGYCTCTFKHHEVLFEIFSKAFDQSYIKYCLVINIYEDHTTDLIIVFWNVEYPKTLTQPKKLISINKIYNLGHIIGGLFTISA